MLKHIAATLLLLTVALPANAASVTIFGAGLPPDAEPSPELSFDFDFSIPAPIVARPMLFITFDEILNFELSLIDLTPNDSNTPSAGYFGGSRYTANLFRNGQIVPLTLLDGQEGFNSTACGIRCKVVLKPTNFAEASGRFDPGDDLRLVGTMNARAQWSQTEPGGGLDFVSLEADIGIDRVDYFGDPLPPVPLPPAIWLFLSALGMLAAKLRFKAH